MLGVGARRCGVALARALRPESSALAPTVGRSTAWTVTLSTHQVRCFWWEKKKDDDDGLESSDEAGKDDKGSESDGDADPPPAAAEVDAEVVSKETAVASVGRGDNAPRHPQVIALPSLTRPLFPGFMMPLTIADEATMHALVELKRHNNPWVGVFLAKPGSEGEDMSQLDSFKLDDVEQLHRVGTFAHIQNIAPTPDGLQVMLMGHRRLRTIELAHAGPPLRVQVHHIDSPSGSRNSPTVRAYTNEILSTIREVIKLNPVFKEHVQYFMQNIDLQDAKRLADFAASLTTSPGEELQEVLETENLEVRLNKALVLLKKEKDLSQLQQEISKEVESRISKQNRSYFLQEQLKSIRRELGMEKDDKDMLSQKFLDRVKHLHMPESAKVVFDEELEKLGTLERNSSEFNVTRSYLDWLTSVPWGVYSEDNLDIKQAEAILHEDHYGLDDVKTRILEFIAVAKLKGSVEGKILCLVGPPGVGKTSIGRSVARALGRKFYRFSVGGLSDVAEIKGHRRTYIGAQPGKLIQCLKSTAVSNPLIMLDELDKLGVGRQGDPASALLELLDPSQNDSFLDHYLDTPVDASKVLFICTANVLDTIPGPLLDRMEVIRVSGYDSQEKLAIAKQYLEPKIRSELGLEPDSETTPQDLQLTDGAVESLIRWYAREAGVRRLEQLIEKLYRKVALKVARKVEDAMEEHHDRMVADGRLPGGGAPASATEAVVSEEDRRRMLEDAVKESVDEMKDSGELDADADADADTDAADAEAEAAAQLPRIPLKRDEIFGGDADGEWVITDDKLDDLVGKPLFTSDRLYEDTPAGVVMGLAWTSMGGTALYIEASTAMGDRTIAVKAKDKDPSGGSIKITGQIGDVMEESSQIAFTVARKLLATHQPDNRFLQVAQVHLHVPEGATPKDGPSAGVTLVTSLLSLATGTPVAANVAMTGELTLGGFVLPVGGIREKVMAARRANCEHVVLPEGCRRDAAELPDHLTDGVTLHFAKTYEDVLKVAFPDGLAAPPAGYAPPAAADAE